MAKRQIKEPVLCSTSWPGPDAAAVVMELGKVDSSDKAATVIGLALLEILAAHLIEVDVMQIVAQTWADILSMLGMRQPAYVSCEQHV
jgi:hypothetical protein